MADRDHEYSGILQILPGLKYLHEVQLDSDGLFQILLMKTFTELTFNSSCYLLLMIDGMFMFTHTHEL